jgi:hypothetical protein
VFGKQAGGGKTDPATAGRARNYGCFSFEQHILTLVLLFFTSINCPLN